MKSRVIGITVLFVLLMIGISVLYSVDDSRRRDSEASGKLVVAVNEIQQLVLSGDSEQAARLAEDVKDQLRDTSLGTVESSRTVVFCIAGCAFAVGVFLYVYISILRPFDKMKAFAQSVAAGNLDIPLDYERSNYFGSFTWAFDSMRREITKARACEREAIDNNKTIIATLSHDIKTPVASIRAYAEGLDANLDTTPEKRSKYLSVIMRKCDEVSKLTNDLFLHSLADLEKLKIGSERFELTSFLENGIREIAAEHDDVFFETADFTAEVTADKNRVLQITENLINNARKYAKTRITVSLEKDCGNVLIHFRDYGSGIPDEDIPFIFEKFYRGHNAGNEQGSGLGLYIVKYLTTAQGGNVCLRNHPQGGLEVTVSLPILNE